MKSDEGKRQVVSETHRMISQGVNNDPSDNYNLFYKGSSRGWFSSEQGVSYAFTKLWLDVTKSQ